MLVNTYQYRRKSIRLRIVFLSGIQNALECRNYGPGLERNWFKAIT